MQMKVEITRKSENRRRLKVFFGGDLILEEDAHVEHIDIVAKPWNEVAAAVNRDAEVRELIDEWQKQTHSDYIFVLKRIKELYKPKPVKDEKPDRKPEKIINGFLYENDNKKYGVLLLGNKTLIRIEIIKEEAPYEPVKDE